MAVRGKRSKLPSPTALKRRSRCAILRNSKSNVAESDSTNRPTPPIELVNDLSTASATRGSTKCLSRSTDSNEEYTIRNFIGKDNVDGAALYWAEWRSTRFLIRGRARPPSIRSHQVIVEADGSRRYSKNNGKADLGVLVKLVITKANGFLFLYPRGESCVIILDVLNLSHLCHSVVALSPIRLNLSISPTGRKDDSSIDLSIVSTNCASFVVLIRLSKTHVMSSSKISLGSFSHHSKAPMSSAKVPRISLAKGLAYQRAAALPPKGRLLIHKIFNINLSGPLHRTRVTQSLIFFSISLFCQALCAPWIHLPGLYRLDSLCAQRMVLASTLSQNGRANESDSPNCTLWKTKNLRKYGKVCNPSMDLAQRK
jgi:hypothetical protein